MSIDDPGWGGDSFGGGSSGGSGGGGGWGSPDHKPPRGRPSWLTVPYLAAGAVVVVVVIVVVVLVVSRGGSSTPSAKVVASRTPTTSVSKTPTSAKPTPTPTGETIAQYDALADAICKKDQPAITAAGTNLQSQYQAQVDEFGDLEELTSPSEQTAVQEDWIKQLSNALTDLTKGDETGYTNELMTANTTAGKLGMTTCNQGY